MVCYDKLYNAANTDITWIAFTNDDSGTVVVENIGLKCRSREVIEVADVWMSNGTHLVEEADMKMEKAAGYFRTRF